MQLEGLKNLREIISQIHCKSAQVQNEQKTYLKFDLGLSNVRLTATAVGNLLSLGNLGTNSLSYLLAFVVLTTTDSSD